MKRIPLMRLDQIEVNGLLPCDSENGKFEETSNESDLEKVRHVRVFTMAEIAGGHLSMNKPGCS
jgi:hypothetical protein